MGSHGDGVAIDVAMKKLLLPAIVFAAVALFQIFQDQRPTSATDLSPTSQSDNSALERAIEAHSDGVQVEGSGTVVKVLGDDNDGSRHQRFIVRAPSGGTILIAHNIDLAQRVSPLNEGDTVSFNGEYVWNSKGGVVHWTHRDPRGQHSPGWIKVDGQVFQ